MSLTLLLIVKFEISIAYEVHKHLPQILVVSSHALVTSLMRLLYGRS